MLKKGAGCLRRWKTSRADPIMCVLGSIIAAPTLLVSIICIQHSLTLSYVSSLFLYLSLYLSSLYLNLSLYRLYSFFSCTLIFLYRLLFLFLSSFFELSYLMLNSHTRISNGKIIYMCCVQISIFFSITGMCFNWAIQVDMLMVSSCISIVKCYFCVHFFKALRVSLEHTMFHLNVQRLTFEISKSLLQINSMVIKSHRHGREHEICVL